MSNKPGRPRALDETKKREVCALISAGCSLAFAGRYVGCSAKTIRRETERDEEFGDSLRKSHLAAQLEPLRAIRGKANTHWRAAAWLLERVDPEQFAKYNDKLYKPEEVSQFLENISVALQKELNMTDGLRADSIVRRALLDVGLPQCLRNTRVNLADFKIRSSDFPAFSFSSKTSQERSDDANDDAKDDAAFDREFFQY